MEANVSAPPGPKGHFFVGSIPELSKDWLGYLADCERRYGPIVRLRMPWPVKELILLTEPALIERVFVDRSNEFRKPYSSRLLEPIFGNGLFLSQGDDWRRQRRMLQPAFHKDRIAAYVDEMVDTTEALLASWRSERSVDGGMQRDVYKDAMKLTFRITAKTMFGVTLDSDADLASQALTEAMRAFSKLYNSRLPLPHFVPTRRSLNLRRAAKRLEHVVDDLIAARKASGAKHADLLSLLLEAKYEDGASLNDQEVREQVMTAFAAGSETTAVALAWTLHLISTHPDVAQAIRSEMQRAVGTSRLTSEHIPQLRYTTAVVKEGMRLFPPGWAIAREAQTDVELGGFLIKRDAQVFTCPYLVHRNPRFFPAAESFLPQRWLEEQIKDLPKSAYFPFGGGPRVCIGNTFAITELVIILGLMLRAADFHPTDRMPKPVPGFTLRPGGGVSLRIETFS